MRSTHPVRRPVDGTRRTGLAFHYKITQGSGAWIYRCRFCGATFEWPASEGSFSHLPLERQRGIRDHYLRHN